jgi:hypothetical protein
MNACLNAEPYARQARLSFAFSYTANQTTSVNAFSIGAEGIAVVFRQKYCFIISMN